MKHEDYLTAILRKRRVEAKRALVIDAEPEEVRALADEIALDLLRDIACAMPAPNCNILTAIADDLERAMNWSE